MQLRYQIRTIKVHSTQEPFEPQLCCCCICDHAALRNALCQDILMRICVGFALAVAQYEEAHT